jgi:NADPH2:quinone reductase
MEEPEGAFKKVELAGAPLRENHVRVRIAAAGVNPLDTKIRAGKAAHAKQPLPAVLCLDMAGIVEEVGTGVTAFRAGDEVYGMVGGVGGLQARSPRRSTSMRTCLRTGHRITFQNS